MPAAPEGLLQTIASEPWRRPWARASGLMICALAAAVSFAGSFELGGASAPLFLELRDKPLIGNLVVAVGVTLLAVPIGLALVRLPSRLIAAGLFALGLVTRLALNQAQRGTYEWHRPFVRGHGTREYPGAFPLVTPDPLRFIDRFAELVPTPGMPVHPSGHPVGATLLAWALDRLTGGVDGLALSVIVLGAAGAWPVLALARRLLDERAARIACLVWALAPSTLIYGATSLDGVFVTIAAAAACAVAGRRFALAAVASAIAFLCSYALALAPLWAALVLGRRGFARAAVWCVGGTLAVLAALALLLGYDPVGALQHTFDAYQRGIGGHRPYAYWVFAGPAAFLLALGPGLAATTLGGIDRATAGARALAACIVLAALSGVMEAEVERIWQFMVPAAAIAAAPLLRSRTLLVTVLVLGAVQAVALELLLDTSW